MGSLNHLSVCSGLSERKTLDINDHNQVADQRFSLKQWFAGGLSLASSENLVVGIVIILRFFSPRASHLIPLFAQDAHAQRISTTFGIALRSPLKCLCMECVRNLL